MLNTREAVQYLKEKAGIKISYGYFLELVRNGEIAIARTVPCPGSEMYLYDVDELERFISNLDANRVCRFCGRPIKTISISGFCSKRCERKYYRQNEGPQGTFWTDSCPFFNGSIKSHIPGICSTSAEYCPFM